MIHHIGPHGCRFQWRWERAFRINSGNEQQDSILYAGSNGRRRDCVFIR